MVRFTDDGGERDSLAPVIPLFGNSAAEPTQDVSWNATWADEPSFDDSNEPDDAFPAGAVGAAVSDHGDRAGGPAAREVAEKALLKKLRARSLSVREARTLVAQHGLDAEQVDDVIASFERLGYLDDAALAEQLIHAGTDRKGQGRPVIAQTLAKRGIPRDVADAALAALPDDDLDRALEFARSKARGMTSLDRDAALRRLAGQLARRGYGGVSLTAARQALDEVQRGSATTGRVRFD